MNIFGDNVDDHHQLYENSKSSSYLEKSLWSNLNANDWIADENENALNSPTPKQTKFKNLMKPVIVRTAVL